MSATAIVAHALRSPGDPFPKASGVDAHELIAAAAHHRVLVLLGSLLRAAGTLDGWPPAFVDACVAGQRDAVAIDCIRQAELTDVLAALAARGVRALTFKGAALAHVCYAAPHLRPHTDTDLLVSAGDVPAAEDTFARLGYLCQHETSGGSSRTSAISANAIDTACFMRSTSISRSRTGRRLPIASRSRSCGTVACRCPRSVRRARPSARSTR